eukprot:scaffold22095_cov71-Attheya_sp.AAC.5
MVQKGVGGLPSCTKTVMGLSCIAPVLLPKVKKGFLKFTVGKSSGDDFPYTQVTLPCVYVNIGQMIGYYYYPVYT